MKKRIISAFLSLVILLTLATPVFATTRNTPSTDLAQHIDTINSTAYSAIQIDGTIFYTYICPDFTYCAQISPSGNLQFSYYNLSQNVIAESPVYSMKEVYNTLGTSPTTDNAYFGQLNESIMDNINLFDIKSQHYVSSSSSIQTSDELQGSSTLSSAMTAAFGANYTGLSKGMSRKTHNGTTYTVYCKEAQSTSYTTPNTCPFSVNTAITAIVTWALAQNYTWVAAVKSIIETAVTTIIVEGIIYGAKAFTAQKTNVSLMLTRIVTVSGYSGTQYWAGWTRKMYFFCGDLGWVHDTNFHSDIKHSDYDDISGLMTKGFNNFING